MMLLWGAEKAVRAIFGVYTQAIGLERYHLPDMDQVATISHQYYDNHFVVARGTWKSASSSRRSSNGRRTWSSASSPWVHALVRRFRRRAIAHYRALPGGDFHGHRDHRGRGSERAKPDPDGSLQGTQAGRSGVPPAVARTGMTAAALESSLQRKGRALHHPPHVVAGTAPTRSSRSQRLRGILRDDDSLTPASADSGLCRLSRRCSFPREREDRRHSAPAEPYSPSVLPAGVRSRFVDNVNGLRGPAHALEAGFGGTRRPAVCPCSMDSQSSPTAWRKVMLPIAAAGYHVFAPDVSVATAAPREPMCGSTTIWRRFARSIM